MKKHFKFLLLSLFLALLGCQDTVTESDAVTKQSPKTIKLHCYMPPPIQDIHKLEPLLIKQGLISENMTFEEKDKALRDYIRRKNQAFNLCKKGKGKGNYEKIQTETSG